ncbi:MAG: hypothetical protein ACRC1K_14010 [Planctomycetia bacterium]
MRWLDGRELRQAVVRLHRWNRSRQLLETAERTAVLPADGGFVFDGLPADEYWTVAVHEPGAGLAMRSLVVKAGAKETVDFSLRPGVAAWVAVRDADDRPIAGARLRAIWLSGTAADAGMLLRRMFNVLESPEAASDAHGRLELPLLPDGAIVDLLWVDHPRFAAVRVEPRVTLQVGAKTGDEAGGRLHPAARPSIAVSV